MAAAAEAMVEVKFLIVSSSSSMVDDGGNSLRLPWPVGAHTPSSLPFPYLPAIGIRGVTVRLSPEDCRDHRYT